MRSVAGNAILLLVLMTLGASCCAESLGTSTPELVCPEGLFIFGTSTVDTGNAVTSIPFFLDPENPPYGTSFFRRPARRYSDGRVLVDYFSQAFRFPLPTPSLRSVAPDFRRGANFAFAGATILASTITNVVFYFGFQQGQFVRLKQNALQVEQQAPVVGGIASTYAQMLPTPSTFDYGLYIIKFNPRNDLVALISSGSLSFEDATRDYVPLMVSSIISGLQNLHRAGARQFLVFTANAAGCVPDSLTNFAENSRDEFGCVKAWNQLTETFNSQLDAGVKGLRRNLSDASIFFADSYSMQRKIFSDPETFGFHKENLLKACCGVGGEYNYDPARPCGSTYVENDVTKGVAACENPGEYVNWDGVHDTEALARLYATFALTGQFIDPPLDFSKVCNLDFSKFTGSNFTEAYPNSILLI